MRILALKSLDLTWFLSPNLSIYFNFIRRCGPLWYNQRIVTYRKTLERLKFFTYLQPSVCWNILYFVNNGTNSLSFEMVLLKKIYCQNVFVLSLMETITLQRLLFHPQCSCKVKTGHYIWSDLNYIDTIQLMNGIVCWYNLLCFKNNMTKKN